jgi:hypothetical protein
MDVQAVSKERHGYAGARRLSNSRATIVATVAFLPAAVLDEE